MYYPRSLTNVILACFVLSAVPLVVALAELAFGLDSLAKRSQLSVREAEAASTASRELRDVTSKIERAVRQSIVLEDASLIDGYRKLDAQLDQTLIRGQSLPLSDEERAALKKLNGQRIVLAAALKNGIPEVSERPRLAESAADLADNAAQAAAMLGRVTEREVVTLREMAAKTRENWPWFLGVAAATALLLAVGFSILISRPLRNIDRNIRKLGRGEFSESILIKGPRDLRSLGERLDWLRRRLLELETHQSRFLRHVSHELKTPLTPLRLHTQILMKTIRDKGHLQSLTEDKITRMVNSSDRQIQRLSQLVDDLLDISRINIGKLELRRETMDFSELVEEVLERYAGQMQEAGCLAELNNFGKVSGDWDRFRLEQVLINLLSNAIKYGRGRPVTIDLGTRDNMVVFTMRDRGIGIAQEDQDRIFQRFERAVSATHFGGLGLGLYIASEIVRAHGGMLRVQSVVAQGSTFTLELPLANDFLVEHPPAQL